jgi:hypothetical protein
MTTGYDQYTPLSPPERTPSVPRQWADRADMVEEDPPWRAGHSTRPADHSRPISGAYLIS